MGTGRVLTFLAAAVVLVTVAAAATTPTPTPTPPTQCVLRAPLDLGRELSEETATVMRPFVAYNATEELFAGTTYRIRTFCVGEHTGTHLDSPYHFHPTGWTNAQIPLERLLANGVFLNVSEETAGNASFRLQPSHIDRWIEQNGPFPDNAVLLISYGWAKFYSNPDRYYGATPDKYNDFNNFRYPGMSIETARKLEGMDQIVGIGMDSPSLDPSGAADAHALLAVKNIYNLENVNLDVPCLPARGFQLHVLPIKTTHGTGGPVRIIAIPEYNYVLA